MGASRDATGAAGDFTASGMRVEVEVVVLADHCHSLQVHTLSQRDRLWSQHPPLLCEGTRCHTPAGGSVLTGAAGGAIAGPGVVLSKTASGMVEDAAGAAKFGGAG